MGTGAWAPGAEHVRGPALFTASAVPGSSHGSGEPLTQQCPHHHSRASADASQYLRLLRSPVLRDWSWRGHEGGAWGRCSSPFTHGLFRSLLPGPPGARARLSRQQQSLVRAPRHGPHRPPRPAGAEASAHAPAHRPLGWPASCRRRRWAPFRCSEAATPLSAGPCEAPLFHGRSPWR